MSAPRHRLSVRIAARALVAAAGSALLLSLILLSEPLEEGESAPLFIAVAILGGLLVVAVYEASVLVTTRALTRLVGPPVARAPAAPRSALTLGYATLVVLGYFGGMFAVAFAAAVALVLGGGAGGKPFDLIEAAWILPLGMAGGAVSGWWTFRRRATLRDLVVLRRWVARPEPRVLALCAAAGCAVAAVAALGLPRIIPVAESFEPGIVAQMGSGSGWPRIYLALMAVLLAPIIEEVLFRGIFLEGMLRATTATVAVGATALLFALAHAPDMWGYWPGLVTVLAGGVALAVLRLRTGSIVTPITCHAAYNATLVALSFTLVRG